MGNTGPCNVNRSYVKHLTDSFCTVKHTNKYVAVAEAVWKLLLCDVVVVSGVSNKGCILMKIAELLGKKSAYIMHGCVEYETQINKLSNMERDISQEAYLLEHADLLLPVSRKFMHWVHARYPHYADKTKYLHNGIDLDLIPEHRSEEKKPNSVIAAGGSRPQKRNDVLAAAVESMAGKARLEIYGGVNSKTADKHYQYVCYMGKVPQKEFVQSMAQSELFVVNSILESFSLAAVEALLCGCSVLISEMCGVRDLLDLEENDMIHEPSDVNEIRNKIGFLLENPNHDRLMSKLDLDKWSYQKSVERLEELCRELART